MTSVNCSVNVSWFNSGCLFNQVRSVGAVLPGHSHVQHYSFRWSQLPFRLELRLKFQLEFLKNSVAICIDITNFCQHTRCYQNSSKYTCMKKVVGSGILQEVLKNFDQKSSRLRLLLATTQHSKDSKKYLDSTENCCHSILLLFTQLFHFPNRL